MEKMITIETDKACLPVLKPILLLPDFVKKIKGGNLKSEIIMLVAEDEDSVFFVSCLNVAKIDASNKDLLKIRQDRGISNDGETAEIKIANYIDLSTIYKINYDDLKRKLDYTNGHIDSLPYLGIENQLDVVNRLTEKLNNYDDLPRLIVIKKNKKVNNPELISSCSDTL
ncbi:hypothetical protein KQ874_00055 [Mycoplasma sp. ES3157-GEN-MYC]|uniref:Uncharacterized protein n=1 Tax=Mycoplasma miroungigenitalium TaxID=754515 RepID=A0A6M4JAW5_9MOLU|nr:hypothetical protein [Mycoplasma miroungigenitalium]MBU4690101.1 hypothetical protein [Mycoplasma miroungigenitalium]MBU4691373.1 hypothetical protein [Mycoplasma miroungigenitalium]QJR43209.1 hypothetical protein HLA87_00060 [Mycoplasma miroungigenitalium]